MYLIRRYLAVDVGSVAVTVMAVVRASDAVHGDDGRVRTNTLSSMSPTNFYCNCTKKLDHFTNLIVKRSNLLEQLS